MAGRTRGQHPPDFPKKWSQLETEGYQPHPLTALGKLLCNYRDWAEHDEMEKEKHKDTQKYWEEGQMEELKKIYPVTDRQVAFYRRYGYVVLPDAIPKDLTAQLREETKVFLLKKGIDVDDLSTVTREKWATVSGTMGGMLELFWLPAMESVHPPLPLPAFSSPLFKSLHVQTNRLDSTQYPTLLQYNYLRILGPKAMVHSAHKQNTSGLTLIRNLSEPGFTHPFGPLNPRHLWLYIDRQNLRFPRHIASMLDA